MAAKQIAFDQEAREAMRRGISKLARAVKTPVFASGGVSSMDDIRKLKELEPDGVAGAVIGRALYEGDLSLKECLKVANG